MGRDRLEEIKYRGTQVIYGDPGMLADLNWLISEFERLRGDMGMQKAFIEGFKVDMEEQEATITTLREALEEIAGMCSYTKYFDGSEWRALVEDIKKKALATAQGDKDVR